MPSDTSVTGRAALADQPSIEQPRVVAFADIPHSADAHRFAGAAHGGVPFSFIRVHSQPGIGPRLHRHPYHEVFVVEAGEATFRVGGETIVVEAGHVVVSPPNWPHAFVASGAGELRLTAIHAAGDFDTEWLEGDEAAPMATSQD